MVTTPLFFESSSRESKGLSVYRLKFNDVFRVFDVEGWARDLFVLGPGHQQHPEEAPSHEEVWSGGKVGTFHFTLSFLLAQEAPCGAPGGTGPHQP